MNTGRRLIAHARSNAVAYAALFVALGGVAWAAADPLLDKRGSVDSKNVKNGEIVQRDLDRDLREQLGLNFKPPRNGPYFGAFNGGNSGITIEIGNGKVVNAVVESSTVAPEACAFQPNPYSSIVNTPITKGLIAVEIANSPSNIFQAEVQYVDRNTVSLSEATINSQAGICLFPQDLELDRLGG